MGVSVCVLDNLVSGKPTHAQEGSWTVHGLGRLLMSRINLRLAQPATYGIGTAIGAYGPSSVCVYEA
jgi:hypothetical protein